jgi:hypothetical protein
LRQRWRAPRQSVRAVATAELAGGARADATIELAGGVGRRSERAFRRRWQTPRQSAWANATAELAGDAGGHHGRARGRRWRTPRRSGGGARAAVHGQRAERVGSDALPEREQPSSCTEYAAADAAATRCRC